MRNTITTSIAGRKHSISPASKDLTFFVIKLIFDSMESLSKLFTKKPDYDDTTSEIMRGLFGLLFTTMASGKTPATMLYQVVYKNPKLETPLKSHLWMLEKIYTFIQFTGWDVEIITSNIKKLYVFIR
jgi:hypothetical protein